MGVLVSSKKYVFGHSIFIFFCEAVVACRDNNDCCLGLVLIFSSVMSLLSFMDKPFVDDSGYLWFLLLIVVFVTLIIMFCVN